MIFPFLKKLQDEIKSRNSRVSSVIEICERLKTDYEQQAEQVPFDLASDLEGRWHQTWLNSVEIQCKLEERLKSFKVSYSLPIHSHYYGFTRLAWFFYYNFYVLCLQKMLIM